MQKVQKHTLGVAALLKDSYGLFLSRPKGCTFTKHAWSCCNVSLPPGRVSADKCVVFTFWSCENSVRVFYSRHGLTTNVHTDLSFLVSYPKTVGRTWITSVMCSDVTMLHCHLSNSSMASYVVSTFAPHSSCLISCARN